nr:MAG TPA: hypothetical protein [Caudoviricetes sp.]
MLYLGISILIFMFTYQKRVLLSTPTKFIK